ncbi:DEAD/DEAH box helicase [Pseudaestuariivita atlantica]|uniref:DEAD/DEAH box helicase n=1 Tax=Pseudaestuariivita atlantica TaxID=1317121 RepID=UPI000B22EEDD|nr:DEAD/DEAH box helicase family protein [Pseudaestuariivita atlantica]
MGIFQDEDGYAVVFHGSQNETEQGRRNFESLDVFLSWADPRDASRVNSHRTRFERLWSNADPNVRCFDIPEAVRRNIAQFYRPKGGVKLKFDESRRWRHQDEAIKRFLAKKSGVLEMATGTGKTRTALRIIDKLTSRDLADTVIVTMRGNDLLDQWFQGLVKDCNCRLYRQYGSHNDGPRFVATRGPRLLLVSQHHLPEFLKSVETRPERTLIVCDEVHGLGSPSQVRSLSGLVSPLEYRLGLSATPEREYDQSGNDFIDEEIGPVIFEFKVEDAIRRGILCEFDYTALEYELSDEDRGEIRTIIKRHHARKASGDVVSDEALYRDISRVRKVTTEKLEPFREHLARNKSLYNRALIFVETRKYGELVQRLLMDAGIIFGTYYEGDESQRLVEFANGRLGCLVSCHRLSEGIDIKSVKNIVLFSSARAKLETIQRLGRCLRTDPEDKEKRAHVLDFVDFGDDEGDTTDVRRYEWLRALSMTQKDDDE